MRMFIIAILLFCISWQAAGQNGQKQDLSKYMNVKWAGEYTFPVSLNLHLTTFEGGMKKTETDTRFYLNVAKNWMGIQNMDTLSKETAGLLQIFDFPAKVFLMLNLGEMIGMAVDMNAIQLWDSKWKSTVGVQQSNTTCRKTGKTKRIQGYVCTQVICTDDNKKIRNELWVTDDFPFDLSKIDGINLIGAYMSGANKPGGMLLEGNFYKNDQLETTIMVTDIDKSVNMVLKTGDYRINEK